VQAEVNIIKKSQVS